MTQDMKKTIATAAKKLILEKPNKKLTVKDIVDECQITRQTFYYHFKDIPELFRWILKQDEENLLHEVESINDTEEALKYFFRLAVNLTPHLQQSMQTNYQAELQPLIYEYCYHFFENGLQKSGSYCNYVPEDIHFFLQYHSYAILGLLTEWKPDDTDHMDEIVHKIYLIIKSGLQAIQNQR